MIFIFIVEVQPNFVKQNWYELRRDKTKRKFFNSLCNDIQST